LKGRIFGPKKGKDEGYRTVDEGNYIIICFIIFYFSPNNYWLTISRSNKRAGFFFNWMHNMHGNETSSGDIGVGWVVV
jgi:hypothetical protein